MKRLFFVFILLCLATPSFAVNPHVAKPHYTFGLFTGGTDNALDSVDGAALSGGETAWVIYEYGTDNYVKAEYVLDADSSVSESGIYIIAPDSNAGTKRWKISAPPVVASDTEPSGVPDGVIWIDTSD